MLKPLIDMLAFPAREMRARHILHSWVYTSTPSDHMMRRACTYPGCTCRERMDGDDWGAFWIDDNEGENNE